MEDSKPGRDTPFTPPDDGIIESVDFQPVVETTGTSWRPSPLTIIVAVAVAIAAVVLLYLFTARSLYVRTSAEQAQVAVDGLLTFTVRDHFLLLPGQHRVRVSAAGYLPNEVNHRVGDASTQYLDIELQPMPGHLTVNSNTPAQVYVDGLLLGASGERLTPIKPGDRQVKVVAERYQPLQQTLLVEGKDREQTLDVALLPNWAEVDIRSEPSGATLLDNGSELGTTPFTAELQAGKHQLQLRLPGHKSWQQIVRVEALEQLQLPTVQLQPADGLLSINSTPAGASVTVNGQFQGKTPLQLELPPGREHQLSLLLEGYQPANRSVLTSADEERKLSIRLQPNLGEIRISARPADALLYVDGILMGRASQTLSLPVRKHRIRVSKAGYADHTASVLPRAGLEQVIDVKLLTEEEYRWKNIPRAIRSAGGQKLLLFRPQDTFTMGASRREQGRRANESQRRVALNKAFYLAERLVTNGEYRQFDRFHSSGHVKGNSLNSEEQPVVNISWLQAARYCNWLSESEKLDPVYRISDDKLTAVDLDASGYRLPSEAEWAWAARLKDGQMQKYGWGDSLPPPEGAGNFGDRRAAPLLGNILLTYDDGFAVTAPAGKFAPNHRGLYDISGNAAEWIHDYYGITTGLSLKPETNPGGPEQGDFHVIRGSSWAHATMTDLRLSFRDYGNDGRSDLSFRVAKNVE